jgi:copper(I)-binding protein
VRGLRYAALAACLALGTTALAACGDSETETSGTTTTTKAAATTTEAAADGIEVTDVWCRTSPMMADAGACYAVITNNSGEDDALVKASVPASVAGKVELHETVAVGGGMSGGMSDDTMAGGMSDDMSDDTMAGGMSGDMSDDTMAGGMSGGMSEGGTGTTMAAGMMEMREVGRIPLPAGETVELKPGGLHIMLLELAAPLTEGSTVELTLEFERAPTQTVQAEVRAN